MSRNTVSTLVAVAVLLVSGCSTENVDYEGQISTDQLATEGITTVEGVLDRLRCESVSVSSDRDPSVGFDDEDALAFAQEQATALGVTVPVENVAELGPGVWAVGAHNGVAVGAVTPSNVSFCSGDS